MSKWVVQAGWDDVPHLTEELKAKLLEKVDRRTIPARTQGIPTMGSGRIYPIPEEEVIVKPFVIPQSWPRVYGFDVGWNRTAGVWAAIDPQNWTDPEKRVVYIYDEYYRGEAEPPVHAAAVKSKGDWIPGAVDPASRSSGQLDGKKLLEEYRKAGLNLTKAKNNVEAGITAVYWLLSTGRLKVFSACTNWLDEYRLYRRDEKGEIVKEHDHLMDATKYLVLTGLDIAIPKPAAAGAGTFDDFMNAGQGDEDTGY